MTFTDAEKTEIRRFCGYPVSGTLPIGFQTWAPYQACGLLEYRIDNISVTEAKVVRRYLSTLTVLEFAIPRAGDNLDTDHAAVWTRNRDEPKDRAQLFDDWRRRLCGFLGIPPGPALSDRGINLIV